MLEAQLNCVQACITCWFLALQRYRFTVKYQAGKQNTVADLLSDHPVGESPEEGNVRKSNPSLCLSLTRKNIVGIVLSPQYVSPSSLGQEMFHQVIGMA